MASSTRYAGSVKPIGPYVVKFMVVNKGETIERGFFTLYEAERFARKISHSKKCVLIACP